MIESKQHNLIDIGLFDLDEFIDWPVNVVNKYFKDKGWEMIPCFNDNKRVWSKLDMNKSIIAKVRMVEDDNLDNEVIDQIWWYEGIYTDSC